MKQPQLYIITNHLLNFSDKAHWIQTIEQLQIEEELTSYLVYASHLSNREAEQAQAIQIEQANDTEIIHLQLNDILIRIDRHIIQLKFPIIFRVFFDYEPLREAIYALILKLFLPCGATELAAYPSYWEQSLYEIKNEWHRKRLAVLQEKIACNCTSYKRTKLNLQFCLSDALSDPNAMAKKQYRAWFVQSIRSYGIKEKH
jgi:hypothetical protein